MTVETPILIHISLPNGETNATLTHDGSRWFSDRPSLRRRRSAPMCAWRTCSSFRTPGELLSHGTSKNPWIGGTKKKAETHRWKNYSLPFNLEGPVVFFPSSRSGEKMGQRQSPKTKNLEPNIPNRRCVGHLRVFKISSTAADQNPWEPQGSLPWENVAT